MKRNKKNFFKKRRELVLRRHPLLFSKREKPPKTSNDALGSFPFLKKSYNR